MENILVAGANSFLGSYLVLELLKRPAYRVCCLMPPSSSSDARPDQRLRARLQRSLRSSSFAEADCHSEIASWGSRLRVISADLPPGELHRDAALADDGVYQAWHVGRTHRDQSHALPAGEDDVKEINQLVGPLTTLGGRLLLHVSTAGVAADHPAVGAIADACAASGLDYRIFRPTVIVADSRTGQAESSNSLDELLIQIEQIKAEVEARIPDYFRRYPLKLLASPAASLNLIAVDRTVAAMAKIAESATSERDICIASDRDIPLTAVLEQVSRIHGIRVQPAHGEQDLNPIDRVLQRRTERLRSCIHHPGAHSRMQSAVARAEASQLFPDPEHCGRNIEQFSRERQTLRQRTRELEESVFSRMVPRELDVGKSDPLNCLVGGEGPETVVIVNAYGQSPAFWGPLVARWLPTWRVILLQPRGTNGRYEGGRVPLFEDQVSDLNHLLTADGAGPYRLIAWCTGPKVALRAALDQPDRISSLVLVTGAFRGFRGTESAATDYERSMEPLLRAAIARPEQSPFILEAVRGLLAGDDKRSTAAHTQVSDILSLISKALRPLLLEPFRNEACFMNYARQLLDFWQRDFLEQLGGLTAPALFIGAENDRIASPQASAIVARGIEGSAFVNIQDATHYCMHENAGLVGSLIEAFWDGRARSL